LLLVQHYARDCRNPIATVGMQNIASLYLSHKINESNLMQNNKSGEEHRLLIFSFDVLCGKFPINKVIQNIIFRTCLAIADKP
jgi:hypothetical protein